MQAYHVRMPYQGVGLGDTCAIANVTSAGHLVCCSVLGIPYIVVLYIRYLEMGIGRLDILRWAYPALLGERLYLNFGLL